MSFSDFPSIFIATKVISRATAVINNPPIPYFEIELNGSVLNSINITIKEMGNSRAELSVMNLNFIIKKVLELG